MEAYPKVFSKTQAGDISNKNKQSESDANEVGMEKFWEGEKCQALIRVVHRDVGWKNMLPGQDTLRIQRIESVIGGMRPMDG